MKKILLSATICVLSVSLGFSQLVTQNNVFVKTNNVINVGIGLGDPTYMGAGYSTVIPPLSASFEHCIIDHILNVASIGVGGYLAYTSHRWGDYLGGTDYSWHVNDLVIAARGAFHYQLVSKLDTYAGIMLGFDIQSNNYSSDIPGATNDSRGSGPVAAIFVGGRYYLTDKFAGNAEMSTGISILTIGVSYKL